MVRGGIELPPTIRYPTGSFALDVALGGGWASGRTVEIRGKESSTKTTLCGLSIAAIQRKTKANCAFFDVEGTTDEAYLASLGVDTSKLFYSLSGGLEETCNIIHAMQESGEIQVIFLDSIEMLESADEAAKGMDDSNRIGGKAQLMNKFYRKFTAVNNKLARAGKTPVAFIAVNQLRDTMDKYNPEFAPGGRGKDFAATHIIRLRAGDQILEGEADKKGKGKLVGRVVKFQVQKNKLGAPLAIGEYSFYFKSNRAGIEPNHIDTLQEIVTAAITFGFVKQGGAWFFLEGEKLQGASKLLEFIRDNEGVRERLISNVLDACTSNTLDADE